MRFAVLRDLGTLYRQFQTDGRDECFFRRFVARIEVRSGAWAMYRLGLIESEPGCTIVAAGALDTNDDSLVEGAVSLDEYEYLPITSLNRTPRITTSERIATIDVDLLPYLRRWNKSRIADGSDSDLNLVIITHQNASNTTDVDAMIECTYEVARGNTKLTLIPNPAV
jgi:hypothetical protein